MEETLGKVILQTFSEKTGGRKLVCGLCGGTRWGIDGITNMPLQDKMSAGMVIGGKVLPLASLTCEVCGNTLFVNIIRLLGRERLKQISEEGNVDKILEEIQRANQGKGGTDEKSEAGTG